MQDISRAQLAVSVRGTGYTLQINSSVQDKQQTQVITIYPTKDKQQTQVITIYPTQDKQQTQVITIYLLFVLYRTQTVPLTQTASSVATDVLLLFFCRYNTGPSRDGRRLNAIIPQTVVVDCATTAVIRHRTLIAYILRIMRETIQQNIAEFLLRRSWDHSSISLKS